mmetsp:Transcript_12857/g.26267  ORF Transcript_12857/g.26267 Transcript_12857/m.26267 type:complete len:250 (-) Transcript_12857:235-984(-)
MLSMRMITPLELTKPSNHCFVGCLNASFKFCTTSWLGDLRDRLKSLKRSSICLSLSLNIMSCWTLTSASDLPCIPIIFHFLSMVSDSTSFWIVAAGIMSVSSTLRYIFSMMASSGLESESPAAAKDGRSGVGGKAWGGGGGLSLSGAAVSGSSSWTSSSPSSWMVSSGAEWRLFTSSTVSLLSLDVSLGLTTESGSTSLFEACLVMLLDEDLCMGLSSSPSPWIRSWLCSCLSSPSPGSSQTVWSRASL